MAIPIDHQHNEQDPLVDDNFSDFPVGSEPWAKRITCTCGLKGLQLRTKKTPYRSVARVGRKGRVFNHFVQPCGLNSPRVNQEDNKA